MRILQHWVVVRVGMNNIGGITQLLPGRPEIALTREAVLQPDLEITASGAGADSGLGPSTVYWLQLAVARVSLE